MEGLVCLSIETLENESNKFRDQKLFYLEDDVAEIKLPKKPIKIQLEYKTQRLCFKTGQVTEEIAIEKSKDLGQESCPVPIHLEEENSMFEMILDFDGSNFICKIARKED